MRNIENDIDLSKLDKLRGLYEFREPCNFCGASSREFVVNPETIDIDGKEFLHVFCKHCGNSKFLLFRIVEKIIKKEDNK